MRPWLVPPRPDEGIVSWNVNTACNYRCTYCTQRFKEDRGRWARDTPRFVAAFARLPGRWEIKLSGGEPFVHPTLDELVAALARLGHRISVVTNFSAGTRELERFAVAAAGRVGVVSCSLHLEYVDDLPAFADKAAWFFALVAAGVAPDVPPPSLSVTTVATRAALPRLDELARVFEARGLSFKVQPEKDEGSIVAYSAAERALLAAHGGHNGTGALEHDFAGRPCWAGARYFILDDRGEAYRCYPARRGFLTLGRRRLASLSSGHVPSERELEGGSLGNFLEPSFALADEAGPCVYRRCYCTVPIARAMMAQARAVAEAAPGPSSSEPGEGPSAARTTALQPEGPS